MDRLSEFIKETYGIMISRDKIIVLINNSEMYYDSVMKKVYLSKDYYYDEI